MNTDEHSKNAKEHFSACAFRSRSLREAEFNLDLDFRWHLSHSAMTGNEVLQIFRDSGALLEGHFVLRSGLHSRQYFQCALALQQMPIVEKLGAELAGKVRRWAR